MSKEIKEIQDKDLIIADRDFIAVEKTDNYENKLTVSDEARVYDGLLVKYIELNVSYNKSSKDNSDYKYTKITLNFSDAEKMANWILATLQSHNYFKEKMFDEAK